MTWTDEKNDRRCALIDKYLDPHVALTEQEFAEMNSLQDELAAHQYKVAPLPIKEARETLQKLRKKAQRGN